MKKRGFLGVGVLALGQTATLELSSREKGEAVWIFAHSVLTDVQGVVNAITSLEEELILTVKTDQGERIFRVARSFPLSKGQ